VSRPIALLLPDLPERLRRLADQVHTLGASEVIGTLEAIKFEVWTSAMTSEPVAAPPTDERPLLTVEAVAHRIGFSKDVVYEMIRRGELQNVGRGRYKRVAAAAVDAWLTRSPDRSPPTPDFRNSAPHVSRQRAGAAGRAGAPPEGARSRARDGDDDRGAMGARRQRRQRPGAQEPDAPGATTWALPPVRRRSTPPAPQEV
jgi:excisionase family DNA binding protein